MRAELNRFSAYFSKKFIGIFPLKVVSRFKGLKRSFPRLIFFELQQELFEFEFDENSEKKNGNLKRHFEA